jgi:hypothetical protein
MERYDLGNEPGESTLVSRVAAQRRYSAACIEPHDTGHLSLNVTGLSELSFLGRISRGAELSRGTEDCGKSFERGRHDGCSGDARSHERFETTNVDADQRRRRICWRATDMWKTAIFILVTAVLGTTTIALIEQAVSPAQGHTRHSAWSGQHPREDGSVPPRRHPGLHAGHDTGFVPVKERAALAPGNRSDSLYNWP